MARQGGGFSAETDDKGLCHKSEEIEDVNADTIDCPIKVKNWNNIGLMRSLMNRTTTSKPEKKLMQKLLMQNWFQTHASSTIEKVAQLYKQHHIVPTGPGTRHKEHVETQQEENNIDIKTR
mgnify:FL=1